MCNLVTVDIFNLTRKCGETNFSYDEGTMRKVLDDENLEIIREEDWLDIVYGHSSILSNDRWLQKVSTDGSWIFSSGLRLVWFIPDPFTHGQVTRTKKLGPALRSVV